MRIRKAPPPRRGEKFALANTIWATKDIMVQHEKAYTQRCRRFNPHFKVDVRMSSATTRLRIGCATNGKMHPFETIET